MTVCDFAFRVPIDWHPIPIHHSFTYSSFHLFLNSSMGQILCTPGCEIIDDNENGKFCNVAQS